MPVSVGNSKPFARKFIQWFMRYILIHIQCDAIFSACNTLCIYVSNGIKGCVQLQSLYKASLIYTYTAAEEATVTQSSTIMFWSVRTPSKFNRRSWQISKIAFFENKCKIIYQKPLFFITVILSDIPFLCILLETAGDVLLVIANRKTCYKLQLSLPLH